MENLLRRHLNLHILGLTAPLASTYGIIGGADGPTAVLVSTSSPLSLPFWLWLLLQAGGAILCLVLAIRVWQLERKLK